MENLGASAVGKVSNAVETATGKVSEVGGNLLSQATGVVQEMQKPEEGVQEGALQQPVYPTGEVSLQASVAPESVASVSESVNPSAEIPSGQSS
ncbi:MAG: hypothetical protein LBG59_00945 [Candidatus Peribacteria bacterium]|nr:hypothetical protein [Candidatus Peribacteria bacterium]